MFRSINGGVILLSTIILPIKWKWAFNQFLLHMDSTRFLRNQLKTNIAFLGISLLILFHSFSLHPQSIVGNGAKNILFIGNSLTYYNDMPQLLQQMLNETERDFIVEQISFPGISLENHLGRITDWDKSSPPISRAKKAGELSATEKKIIEKEWYLIVIQNGMVSFFIPEAIKYSINPAIEKIQRLIDPEKPNSCCLKLG